MRSLIPVLACCISLVSLQQLSALPAGERSDTSSSEFTSRWTETHLSMFNQSSRELTTCCRNLYLPRSNPSISPLSVHCLPLHPQPPSQNQRRLDLLNKMIGQEEELSLPPGGQTNGVTSSESGPLPKWLPAFLRHPPASGVRGASPGLAWAQPTGASPIKRRLRRSRRQAQSRGAHHYPKNAQLMRVGCVLGTCQVQNLSHRLYQLIGQTGREESAPINPRSPHSYG